jgi:hypothetical protein
MSSRAGFWATFLTFVVAAIVAFVISGLSFMDLRHLGTPRNALLDGSTEVRVPLPPASAGRLLPEVPVTTTGQFAFMFEDKGEPVRFDPCRAIHYVYNASGQPAGLGSLIQESVDSVSAATGLEFVYDGQTDEVAQFDRRLFQPDRYGEGFAPVIIGWSNEATTPDLAGSTTGLGGSNSVTGAYGDQRFLQAGTVVLDTTDIAGLLATTQGRALARAVIIHEIGHVVGLAHVADPTELMNASNTSLTTWGPGDLKGLAILGAGPCQGG